MFASFDTKFLGCADSYSTEEEPFLVGKGLVGVAELAHEAVVKPFVNDFSCHRHFRLVAVNDWKCGVSMCFRHLGPDSSLSSGASVYDFLLHCCIQGLRLYLSSRKSPFKDYNKSFPVQRLPACSCLSSILLYNDLTYIEWYHCGVCRQLLTLNVNPMNSMPLLNWLSHLISLQTLWNSPLLAADRASLKFRWFHTNHWARNRTSLRQQTICTPLLPSSDTRAFCSACAAP